MTENEKAQVFGTILSTPGMNETVKVDMKISRRNVLLLSSIIEKGLSGKGEDKAVLLAHVPEESIEELRMLSEDCLKKAGLVELNENIKSLSSPK